VLGAGTDLAVSTGLLPAADPTTGSGGWSAALPSIAATATAVSVVLIPWDNPTLARIRFWTAAGAGAVSLLVVLSYVYESSKLILGLGLTGTSLPMALLGLVIVAASMSARPDLPPLRWLDTYYERGVLRRLLPLLALTPFIPAVIRELVDLLEPDAAAADAIAQLVTVVVLLAVIVVMGGGRSRARRELATQRQRVWVAFAHAPSGTAVVSLDGRIVAANDALLRLTGRTDLEGTSAVDLIADVDQVRIAEALAEIAAGRDGFRRDVRLRGEGTAPIWVDLNVAPVREVSGRVQYLVMQCADLTDRKDLERLLAEMAIRDPLTGLLNRDGLEQQISVLRRAARQGRDVVVVFVDVDGLKAINDSQGHSGGDEVLREVARRLRASTRSEDVVARIGGDEFVVVTTAPSTARRPRTAWWTGCDARSTARWPSAPTPCCCRCPSEHRR
jgi:PAS domain S-box-containing protein